MSRRRSKLTSPAVAKIALIDGKEQVALDPGFLARALSSLIGVRWFIPSIDPLREMPKSPGTIPRLEMSSEPAAVRR